jgi:hypothetical protein
MKMISSFPSLPFKITQNAEKKFPAWVHHSGGFLSDGSTMEA